MPILQAVILAAGKGTRMKSGRAKVLHEVLFAPMITHVLDLTREINFAQVLVVTGHQRLEVAAAIAPYRPQCVVQEEQKGTGHAVLSAAPELLVLGGTAVIICGDTPLLRPESLHGMIAVHRQRQAMVTVMTTELAEPRNYGRIIVDAQGGLVRIVEEKDASATEKLVKEVNVGIYCVEVPFLCEALGTVGTDNQQGEVYLTDIVGIAHQRGLQLGKFICPDAQETLGVNSRVELASASKIMQRRKNIQLMEAGVTLDDPETNAIEKTVPIAAETRIARQVQIFGRSKIGRGCEIGPFTVLRDCVLGEGVTIGSHCLLEGLEFAAGTRVAAGTGLRG